MVETVEVREESRAISSSSLSVGGRGDDENGERRLESEREGETYLWLGVGEEQWLQLLLDSTGTDGSEIYHSGQFYIISVFINTARAELMVPCFPLF